MKENTKQIIINIVTIVNIIIIGLLIFYLIANNKYNIRYIRQVSDKLGEYNNYILQIDNYDVETKNTLVKRITQTNKARVEEDKDKIH